jgi:hypothetical protein
VVRVPDYITEMYWASCEVRTEFICYIEERFMYSVHVLVTHILVSQALYTVCCSSKLYAHKNVCKPKLVNVFDKKAAAQIGTNARARGFNAGLLARSQFASGRSCDRPTRLRFSVVFLGLRSNAELVPKFNVALHASHVALPIVTLKFRPCVALLMSD